MSLLHVYFVNRKQQAFRRLLDQGSSQGSKGHTSSSGGKSWSRLSPLSSTQLDVNARDWLGRTVLHLAASATDASASEYVRMLLAHPSININIQDRESHWTALHRALYHGNLATTILLLRRPDIDTDLKDFEGYRALDLYNSTVEGTKPEVMSPSGKVDERLDLFTWGSNRNATLGLGDADDRTFPDQVLISRPDTSFIDSVDSRFNPVRVCEIAMSKLHTGSYFCNSYQRMDLTFS